MAKNKITVSFKLFSLVSVLLATVLSKVLQIIYMWASSDITVAAPVKYICYYGYDLFNLMAVALAITVSVYAHSYFGKKTCVGTSLISLACLTIGKVIMFVYNLIANKLSAAQLISGALSYLVEILFDALVILLAIIFSYIFAKRRDCSPRENSHKLYAPIKAAFSTACVYYLILITDLTVMNVIPFFVKYDDPTESEIKNIISDYLYYIFGLPVTILLIGLSFFLIVKVTGKLRAKQYYQNKE